MSRRRSIHRKQPERPTSRRGLLLCLLLAGAVVLVPVGGGFLGAAKSRLLDLALGNGLIDLNDCVVTQNETISCAAGAIGVPVPEALRQMTVLQTQAVEDARRRGEAETALRALAVEIDRLKAEAEQNRLAVHTEGATLPTVVTTVTRTGVTSDDAADLPIQVMPNPLLEPTAEPYEPVAEE